MKVRLTIDVEVPDSWGLAEVEGEVDYLLRSKAEGLVGEPDWEKWRFTYCGAEEV